MQFIEFAVNYWSTETEHGRSVCFGERLADDEDVGGIKDLLERLPQNVKDKFVTFCKLVATIQEHGN